MSDDPAINIGLFREILDFDTFDVRELAVETGFWSLFGQSDTWNVGKEAPSI